MTTVADIIAAVDEGEEKFLKRFDQPVLIVSLAQHRGRAPTPNQTSIRATARVDRRGGAFVGPSARVTKLERRGRHAFPVITIGRAESNDIVVEAPGLSNLHATFARDASGGWTVSDGGSRNGTLVGDRLLAPRESVKLADGDELVLGNEVVAIFLTPRALFGWARLHRELFKPET